MSKKEKPLFIQTKRLTIVVKEGIVYLAQWSGVKQIGSIEAPIGEFRKITKRLGE